MAALSMITVSCAALAGCSSGPSPTQQAQSSRASAMAAAKNVHSELGSVRIASSVLITGNLYPCGTSDELATDKGAYAVQYTASQEWFLRKPGSVPLATLGRDIVQKLEAAGWRLRSAPTPNPEPPPPRLTSPGATTWTCDWWRSITPPAAAFAKSVTHRCQLELLQCRLLFLRTQAPGWVQPANSGATPILDALTS